MRRSYDLDANAWVRRAADTLSIDVHPGSLPPAKGLWAVPAKEPKVSPGVVALLFFGSCFALLVGIIFFHVPSFLISLVFLPFQLFFTFGSASGNMASKRDLLLLEDDEDANVCLVAVTLRRQGKTLGRDRGVVWFSDGLLLYNGHRTSFAIGGQDLVAHQEVAKRPELSDTDLVLGHPDGELVVKFAPLAVPGRGSTTPMEMRFRKRFYDFKRQTPYADEPRQWPPSEV